MISTLRWSSYGELRGQLGLPFLDRAVLLVEPLLTLGQPVITTLHLQALLAQVVPDRLGFGLGFAPYVGRPLLGLSPYLQGPVLRGAADLLGTLLGRLRADPQYGGLFLGLAPDELGRGLGAGGDMGGLELGAGGGRGTLGGFPAGEGEADPGQQSGDQQSDQGQPEGRRCWQGRE